MTTFDGGTAGRCKSRQGSLACLNVGSETSPCCWQPKMVAVVANYAGVGSGVGNSVMVSSLFN